MPREGDDTQEFEKQDKVYPALLTERVISVVSAVVVIILLIASILWNLYAYEFAELMRGEPEAPPGSLLHAAEVADIEDLADRFRVLSLAVIAMEAVALVSAGVLAATGSMVKEIALGDAGVVVRRWGLGPWRRPITIQKLTEVKEIGRGRALKIAGVTPEGRRVTRQLSRVSIGGKRLQELKDDLEKYAASTEKE